MQQKASGGLAPRLPDQELFCTPLGQSPQTPTPSPMLSISPKAACLDKTLVINDGTDLSRFWVKGHGK